MTETWLTDGESLEEEVSDLVLGTGLQMVYRNREPNDRGFSHGGVAVVYKEERMTLRKIKLHNPKSFEIMLTAGSIKGSARKLAIIACYIPCLLYTSPSPRD